MSDYGMTEYPGGFRRMPPPPVPAEPVRGSSSAYLATLLVVACVVLGVLLAWGIRERGERTRLSIRNKQVEDAYVFVLAKRNDLASFLTDPRTRLYRMAAKGRAGGGPVTIAWQEDSLRGVLIADRMPAPGDREGYALWRLMGGSNATSLGTFRPEAAGTFYEFTLRREGDGGAGEGFIVTREKDARPVAPGEVVYETR